MASRSPWARAASRYRPYLPYVKYPLVAVTWIPVFIWFTTNIAETTTINGASMTPFFNDRYNQSLKRDLCLNLKYRGAREKLQRGMIVTFRCPLDPEKIQVKRVIGLEWDVIVTRPPYAERLVRVPQGHIWVEGDAKETEKTLDSNTYGPISKQLVTGQISHILLPWRKAGIVRWWEYRDNGANSIR